MSTTKKQAKEKIQPLVKEIEGLKKDLKAVSHPSSIHALEQVIEDRVEVLKMWKKHAGI